MNRPEIVRITRPTISTANPVINMKRVAGLRWQTARLA